MHNFTRVMSNFNTPSLCNERKVDSVLNLHNLGGVSTNIRPAFK